MIFFIGDGMGFEHVKAGGNFVNGAAGTLLFEGFPYKGEVITASANAAITDSAAAATAMATGTKVDNGVVAIALPGDGSELKSVTEIYAAVGKSVGLVTSTTITHATPAAFGAHAVDRNLYAEIATDYMQQTRPNVLFGGGGAGMDFSATAAAGYAVATNKLELNVLDSSATSHFSGQFGVGHLPFEFDGLGDLPHLWEMTESALAILESNSSGFFLMVEGGRIDHAGHINDIERNVRETAGFEAAVDTAYQWAKWRYDTLIVVTADHETGGMNFIAGNGVGIAPTVSWSTSGHTAVNVPVYAWGNRAYRISGVMDNTEFFSILKGP